MSCRCERVNKLTKLSEEEEEEEEEEKNILIMAVRAEEGKTETTASSL